MTLKKVTVSGRGRGVNKKYSGGEQKMISLSSKFAPQVRFYIKNTTVLTYEPFTEAQPQNTEFKFSVFENICLSLSCSLQGKSHHIVCLHLTSSLAFVYVSFLVTSLNFSAYFFLSFCVECQALVKLSLSNLFKLH